MSSSPRGASAARAGFVAAPLLAAVVVFPLVRAALLPGVAFWDTGEFQVIGPVLGTAHPTGFPAYVLLGWFSSVVLQAFGEPAFIMNLLSAILVAAAAAVTVVLVRMLTGRTWLGVAAGIGLGASPVAWRIGTHADPHALHLVLVPILLAVLVGWERRDRAGATGSDRWIVVAAALFGASLANHSLTYLLAPGIALFVVAVRPGFIRRGRLVGGCVLALVGTAALLYAELPLRAGPFRAPLVYGHPETLDGFRYVVLAEQFTGAFDAADGILASLGVMIETLAAQFDLVIWLLPIAFVVTAIRLPRYALLTGMAFALTCLFSAFYVNAEIDRYYLGPTVIGWSWIAILVAAMLDRWWSVDGGVDVPPATLRATRVVEVLVAVALLVPTAAAAPVRLEAADQSRDRAAAAWLDSVLAVARPDAVVVSWWSYSTPLWYAQHIEGRRPDIRVIDDRTRLDENLGEVSDVIDAHLGRQPVYVIRAHVSEIEALGLRYRLVRVATPGVSLLYEITGRIEEQP